MERPLEGIRVLEVAQWWFVPSAGAVLADWGADVVKIEHPVTGDPQRGLITSGLVPDGGFNFMWEQPNRGKRSVGLDIGTEGGRALLYRIAEQSDVFLTSFLPPARRKLGIDVDDIRGRNPRIIYARGSGQGARGPDAEKGGYDAAAFWSRGGLAEAFTGAHEGDKPMIGQRPAFGDGIGGMNIAGSIAAALFRRERTGKASIVDISLLSTACWTLSPDITAAPFIPRFPSMGNRRQAPNPVVNSYKTRDNRWLMFIMLQPDRYWADFCRHLDRPDLIDDERFRDATVRFQNREACVDLLDQIFARHTLAEWKLKLDSMEGVWAPMQTPVEIHEDPQVIENGYLREVTGADGARFKLAASPAQFDEAPLALSCAPEHGQHTEEVLLELGLSWDDIAAHKQAKAIL